MFYKDEVSIATGGTYMNLLWKGLLFGIAIFIFFVIWDYIKEGEIDWSDSIIRSIIYAVVYILITALMDKNEKVN